MRDSGCWVGLETAVLAAAAFYAAVDHRNMPEFAAVGTEAGKELALVNNGAADAGSEGEHEHALKLIPEAPAVFAEGGAVRVVSEKDGNPQLLFKKAHGVNLFPVDVGRKKYRTLFAFADAGNSDAHKVPFRRQKRRALPPRQFREEAPRYCCCPQRERSLS